MHASEHAHAACESASRLVCEHPFFGALIPLVLILLVVAGSGLAAYCSTRTERP